MKFKKGDKVRLIKFNVVGIVTKCTRDMVYCNIGEDKDNSVPFSHPDHCELVKQNHETIEDPKANEE